MDVAIERNSEALKRVVATLVAIAGLAVGPLPEVRTEGEPRRTLPRHLWLAILRLLRPAEAAARRLIIAAARGLVVPPPAPPRKPKPMSSEPLLRSLGIAIVMSPADLARAAADKRTAAPARPRKLCLPLFDPLRHPYRFHRRYVPPHAAPRISVPGFSVPSSLPPPPSPDDPVSAARLGQRLAALASALDDLPGQAKRFARWKARLNAAHASGRFRRISPLRPGRPPGGRLSRFDPTAVRPRNIREVDEILAHAHALALYALERPDTS